MKNCPQFEGQSTLEHGFSVKNYLFDIINHLRNDTPLKYKWVLPDWLYESKELIINDLPDDKTLKLYTIFHDCGKWKCITFDKDGKHFKNHADVSYDIFNQLFDNETASYLIKHDMDVHLLKSDGGLEFSKNKYALTLVLTALAEIHSNSNFFGGVESTSFKIKNRCISKRGKQLINLIKTNKK